LKFRTTWLLAVVLAALIIPAAAQATPVAATPSLSGNVTDPANASVQGVEVCAYLGKNQTSASGCTQSGADGNYVLTDLAPGSYKVAFYPSYASPYANQFYNGKTSFATAEAITLSEGEARTEIDAVLFTKGAVSGTVTAAGGGPIAGLTVCAYGIEMSGSSCSQTNASGEYWIEYLQLGQYRVEFRGGTDYVDQYFDGAARQAEADPVTVNTGPPTPGIDAEMQPAGKIEGTVVDAVTEAGVENVEVCPEKATGYLEFNCAWTDSSGHYVIGGLPAGSYLVSFAEEGQDYLDQYFNGSVRRGEASPLTVAAGATVSSVDARMTKGAQITGTVTDQGGSPIEGVEVCAEANRAREENVRCATTAGDGTYAIHPVPSGAYRIHFRPSSAGNYLDQYYDDEPNRNLADLVQVTAPVNVTGIDAEMHPGGMITGTITDAATSSPLPSAEACAVKAGTERQIGCQSTGPNGEYTLEGLPTGTYEVLFASSTGYLPERYNDQPFHGTGTQLGVSAGATVSGIDAGLTRGSTISGHVKDATSGEPAPWIQVCALAPGEAFGGCGITNGAGDYKIQGLEAGAYELQFVPINVALPGLEFSNRNYVTQYWDGKTTEAAAEPVAVAAGADMTGFDAEMSEGGGISGTITDPSGEPVATGFACAVMPSEAEPPRCDEANANGEYEIQGLAQGAYKVRFTPQYGPDGASNLLPQFWNDAASAATATNVFVAATGVTGSIDAHMHAGGQIEGRVTVAGSGAPLEGAEVCAIPVGQEKALGCEESESNGDYVIPALPTGEYDVEFSVPYYEEGEELEEFKTQFFSGAGTRTGASAVGVTAGSPTGSIDASMVEIGPPTNALTISPSGNGAGTVTSSPAGISCGSACSARFAVGSRLTLTATPAPGSTFAGWTGACSGTGTCQVRLVGSDLDVGAVFTVAAGGAPPVGAPAPPSTPKPRAKKPHCRKGFKAKKAHGKWHCAKVKKHKHHHRRR
jgi:5-hydroxyisourate hydrolase-like protein (transthyretin family)